MFRFLHALCLLILLESAAAQQPNIVFIVSDDAGFADFGFMDAYTQSVNPGQAGSPVPTPRLDELRARGVLFTDAYTAAVCSPSRGAFLTGSYQQRIGYEYNINNLTNPNGTFEGLRAEDITIFERMQERGYTTGAIGKWHVGGIPDIVSGGVVTVPGNRPPRQGVDEFFGILRGSRNYSVGGLTGDVTRALREMSLDANGLEVNTELEANYAGQYVTNTFGQGAVDFIDRHHTDADPFFLYVSFTAPHAPIGASPDRNAPGVTSDYGSMVYTMDKEIGRIMDKIADPIGDGSVDLTSDTLFIFINDNGGANGIGARNTPLRNWKGSTYEGGIRVPMLFAGAGVTVPAGSVYSQPVHSIDILPTCYELAGGAPLAGIDGVNLLPHVNGTAAGVPHEAVVVRNKDRYGIRMADWKLARSSGSAPELYDLSSNIAENSAANLAAANPTVVEQLLRTLAEHEVGFDKPRFHGLSSGVDSINRNDHFRFAPSAPTGSTFIADLQLVGAGLNNGDFESPVFSADTRPYSEVDGWTNIGTGGDTQVLGRTNLTRSSAQNAVISEAGSRMAALDTGHVITAGEVYGFSYWWRDASGWNDGADRMGIRFYTTVDDTIDGTVNSSVQYTSPLSTADSAYELADGTHTATAAEDGRRLFITVDGVDGNASTGGFARLDDVSVARGMVSGGGAGGGTVMMDWAAAGVWTDVDTGLADTLLEIDAFAGAVLEFPVSDGFSYVAENSMTRATGEEFMLNTLLLSGTATGAQSATLSGLDLLFTPALDGAPARIGQDALGSDYQFTVETPIEVWDGLIIEGDGTAPLAIRGGICMARPDAGDHIVQKSGSGAIEIGGQALAVSMDVTAGSLHLDDAVFGGTADLWIRAGATLSGAGEIGGTLDLDGEWVIDLAAGDYIDMQTFEAESPATLRFIGTPAGAVQVFASYQVLDLVPADVTLTNVPAGYVVDFAYQGNQIALRQRTPYEQWAQVASGLSGADAGFDADANGDGIANGLAFFTGAVDAHADARLLTAEINATPGALAFSLRRDDSALSHQLRLFYSTDLIHWNLAVDGRNGVSLTVIDDGYAAGIDLIDASFPAAIATDGDLFLRYSIEE